MAACTLFDEDEVCMAASSGGFKYGLVVESSEYSSSDEEDDEHRVKKGTVKVAWHPNGDEHIVAEKKVLLADRSLMPGDVVRRFISGKDSQRGFIQSITVKCHVKVLGTDTWIYNVDSKKIRSIQEWDPELEVVLDSWVGMILEVKGEVTLRFPCGARCKLEEADMYSFEDVNEKRKENSVFLSENYYPGQEICTQYPDDFNHAKWIESSSIRNASTHSKSLMTVPVLVEEVETIGLDVRWLCRGFTQVGKIKDSLEIPSGVVKKTDLERLKSLNCFEHCSIQIGDRGFYTVEENDVIMKGMSPRLHAPPDALTSVSQGKLTVLGASRDGIMFTRTEDKTIRDTYDRTSATEESRQPGNSDTGACGSDVETPDKDIVEIDVRDNADKSWEDLVEEDKENIEDQGEDSDTGSNHSAQNSPSSVRKRNRKRPCLHTKSVKKLKGKRARMKMKMTERMVKPGEKVPVEVCYTFSVADVMWQDDSVECAIPSPQLFPIHHLDEFEFFPGDYVVDAKGSTATEYGVVASCDHRERTCLVRWIKPYLAGQTKQPEVSEPVEVSVYDITDHPDYKFRPGSVVIRVGGFEEKMEADLEAVGQVYQLDPEGIIYVWWPNNTITTSYPQDLYIINHEMSDINSSNWSDEDDDEEEEEEEEEEEGSDVSWETENEEEVDEEAEEEEEEEDTADTSKEKGSEWAESKMKDLDELLQRVVSALTGLLDLFSKVPGPFFKNSKQVFQDILSIFKRCKEMEKNLKSSFFDDPEISDLVSEVREQLRKEKTTKLARHVAQLYEYRNNVSAATGMTDAGIEEKICDEIVRQVDGLMSNRMSDNKDLESNEESINQKTEPSGATNETDKSLEAPGTDCSTESAACSVSSPVSEDSHALKLIRGVLNQHINSLDDPVSQVLFHTCLDAVVAEHAQGEIEKMKVSMPTECGLTSSQGFPELPPSEPPQGDTDVENYTDGATTEVVQSNSVSRTASDLEEDKGKRRRSAQEFIESVINAVFMDHSTTPDSATRVRTLREQARRRVEQMCEIGMVWSESDELTYKKDASVNTSQWMLESGTQTSSECLMSNKSNQTDTTDIPDTNLSSNHRMLCIRVCKALNKRVIKIQNEVSKRWQAYQLRCQQQSSSEGEATEDVREVTQVNEGIEIPSVLDSQTQETNTNDTKAGELNSSVDNGTTGKPADVSVCPQEKGADAENTTHLVNSVTTPDDGTPDIEDSPTDSEKNCLPSAVSDTHLHSKGSVSEIHFCEEVPASHWYKFQEHKPSNPKSFHMAVRRELMLLRNSLPEGIIVKTFEDRMDLFSVLIAGPENTPYADGLFAFDIQLPNDYSSSPPNFHYISFCNERLNPNLYEDGKVCVSLLGTWSGKGNEVWTSKSNLLQVLVSIQGLILVSEPYFNEAGYERQRHTQEGEENSRMYNEMAILKLVQSMTKMAVTPPTMFVEETIAHLQANAFKMVNRLESWIQTSSEKVSAVCTDSHSQSTTITVDREPAVWSCDSTSTNGSALQVLCDGEQNICCHGSAKKALKRSETDDTVVCDHSDTVVCDHSDSCKQMPDFPLLPASKGFCLTLKKNLDIFKNVLKDSILKKPSTEVLI